MNILLYFFAFYVTATAASIGADEISASKEQSNRKLDSRGELPSSLMQRLKDRRGKESGGVPDINGGSLKSGSASNKSWDKFLGEFHRIFI